MANKDNGAARACSICKKSGHNARTCEMRSRSGNTSAGESSTSAVAAAPSSTNLLESEGAESNSSSPVLRDRPSSNGYAGAFDVRHEPVSFSERTVQEHVNGVTYRLTAREYQNGATTINLKVMSEAQEPKDIQLDLQGASKVVALLGGLMQEIAKNRQQRAPVSRLNGLSHGDNQQQGQSEARQ